MVGVRAPGGAAAGGTPAGPAAAPTVVRAASLFAEAGAPGRRRQCAGDGAEIRRGGRTVVRVVTGAAPASGSLASSSTRRVSA
jgi:hypothetical protein